MILCVCCGAEVKHKRLTPLILLGKLAVLLGLNEKLEKQILCQLCSQRLRRYCRLSQALKAVEQQIKTAFQSKTTKNNTQLLSDDVSVISYDVIDRQTNGECSVGDVTAECSYNVSSCVGIDGAGGDFISHVSTPWRSGEHQKPVNIEIVQQPSAPCRVSEGACEQTARASRHTAAKPRRFVCCSCGSVFSSRTALCCHQKSQCRSGAGAGGEGDGSSSDCLQCRLCHKTFRSQPRYMQHMSGHCDSKLLSCPLCSHRVKSVPALQQHLQNHPSSGDLFVCDKCDLKFISLSRLRTHQIRAHGLQKPWRCEVSGCDRSFKSVASLQLHSMSHGSQLLLPFCCPVCRKRFANRHRLLRHSRVHTGERPYQCHVCGRLFAHQPNLCQHMNLHRRNGTDTPTNIIATPNDLIAAPTNIIATPTNMIATPNDLIATPTNIIATPTDLVSNSSVTALSTLQPYGDTQ